MASILSNVQNWLTGTKREPSVCRPCLQVLRIPADGSPRHLLRINTIHTISERNIDSFLRDIPDFRSFWGSKDGLHWRDGIRIEITGQSPPVLDGIYYGWKSFAFDEMPISKHTGFCGDAFFARTRDWDFNESSVAWDDVPPELLGSELLEVLIEKLHLDEGVMRPHLMVDLIARNCRR